MSRIDYYRAVLSGVVIGVVFITGFYIFTTEDKSPASQSKFPAPQPNFVVVDKYKGCDVVRWNYNRFAEYKYFLYCNDKK
jgi:hypothetical protein